MKTLDRNNSLFFCRCNRLGNAHLRQVGREMSDIGSKTQFRLLQDVNTLKVHVLAKFDQKCRFWLKTTVFTAGRCTDLETAHLKSNWICNVDYG